MQSGDAGVQRYAVTTLNQFPPKDLDLKFASELLAALPPRHLERLQETETYADQYFASHGKKAFPSLVKALENPNLHTRDWPLEYLGRLGPDARPAANALATMLRTMMERDIDQLQRSGEDQRLHAVLLGHTLEILLQIKPPIGEIGPTLKTILEAPPPLVNINAKMTATKLLAAYHSDAAEETRRQVGISETQFISLLIELRNDPAKDILVQIGRPAVPALIEALQISDRRSFAIETLGRIGPVTDAVIPAFIAVLDLERTELKSSRDSFSLGMDQEHVFRTLGNMGPNAVAAVPGLMAKLVRHPVLNFG